MSAKPHAGIIFVRVLLGLLAIATLSVAFVYWRLYGFDRLFGDFDVFHKAAIHAVSGDWRAIYDLAGLKEMVKDNNFKDLGFSFKPPTELLLIYPFGFLSRVPALLLWTGLQLALLWSVLRLEYMRGMLASSRSQSANTSLLLGVTFLAFSLQNILYGQVAVFCSALFILVLAWRNSHPLWAGILLGVFSFKPQLGVLLPLMLIAERNWRVLAAAALVTLLMILLSYLCFGPGLWVDYREAMGLLEGYVAGNQSVLFALTMSPSAGLRMLGIPLNIALALQLVLACLIVIWSWPVLKSGNEVQKIQLLILATYLVTPYSLLYDMVLIALPLCLLLRRCEADRATRGELIALLALTLLPCVTFLLQIAHIPYAVIAIGLAFGVARLRTDKEIDG